MSQSAGRGEATIALAVLGGLTAVGFLLRLPGLSTSLFADELGTYYLVAGHSAGGIVHQLATRTWDLNPPLYYLFAWLGRRVAGNHVESLRLISIAAGTACIPCTYVLGRLTVGRRAGMAAATLMSLSPFMVYFSSEARAFALAVLLCLVSTIALIQALRTRRPAWWAAYAAAICAAMYTQYTSFFVLAIQFVWAFWTHGTARRPLLTASAAGAVAFLPWLPGFFSQGRSPLINGIGILEPFSIHVIWHDLLIWSVGAPFIATSIVPGGAALALTAAGCLVVLAGVARRAAALRTREALQRPAAESTLLVCLALAAPVGAALYSALSSSSIWEAKDLITSWPALALVVGWTISRSAAMPAIAGTALLLAGLAFGSVRLIDGAHQRPNYDAAARYVRQAGGSEAPIAEVAGLTPGPVQAMEVAVAVSAGPDPNPVLRVGAPALSLVLGNRPGAALGSAPARVVARQATAQATGGRLFLVMLGSLPTQTLIAWRRMGPDASADIGLTTFVRDIPPQFRLTARRTFPGFIPVSVYTFSDR